MILGEGTPLTNLVRTGAQSVTDGAFSISGAGNEAEDSSRGEGRRLIDFLDISEEARAHLQNDSDVLSQLDRGRGDIIRSEARFLNERLAQIKEQIGFLKNLASGANAAQQEILLKGIEQAGQQLGQIGRNLGLVSGDISSEYSQTQIVAGELSLSFNQSVTIESGGRKIAIEQSQSFELKFLHISSVSVSTEAHDTFTEITGELRAVAEGFQEFIKQFEQRLSDDKRIPPSIMNMIKDIIERTLNPETIGNIDTFA